MKTKSEGYRLFVNLPRQWNIGASQARIEARFYVAFIGGRFRWFLSDAGMSGTKRRGRP